MRYMNDYDLFEARRRWGRGTTPNRLALAIMVDALRHWADHNSDGWAYWVKPLRAAQSAIALVSTAPGDADDITDAAMAAAARPVKAFLTRAKATPEDRERILRSVDPTQNGA